jgi:predicted nucleotidyltransferase
MEFNNNSIEQLLQEIEKAHNVYILFAAESGSRVWGWASDQSDHDVRFIYCHKIEHYLAIEEGRREVIDFVPHSGIEFHGWEIRKTLKLLREGNPGIFLLF